MCAAADYFGSLSNRRGSSYDVGCGAERQCGVMIFLGKVHLGLRDDGGASADDPISEIRI